jgi:hypothetical protein
MMGDELLVNLVGPGEQRPLASAAGSLTNEPTQRDSVVSDRGVWNRRQ